MEILEKNILNHINLTDKEYLNARSYFKSKKLKKAIKESKDKPIKKSTSKIMEERKINRKTKKMTETEGSFAKGGRAGYKGGGMSQRGLGRAFMKGGKV